MRNAHESNRWEDRVVDNGIEAKGSRWKFVLVQLAGVFFFFIFFRRGIVGALLEGKVQRPFLSSDG